MKMCRRGDRCGLPTCRVCRLIAKDPRYRIVLAPETVTTQTPIQTTPADTLVSGSGPKPCAACQHHVEAAVKEAMEIAAGKRSRFRARPGTEMKKLLMELGQKAGMGCECNKRAAKMDAWGIEGCKENEQEILGWLKDEAEKRGWGATIIAAAHVAASAKIRKWFDPLDPYGSIFRETIRRAELAEKAG